MIEATPAEKITWKDPKYVSRIISDIIATASKDERLTNLIRKNNISQARDRAAAAIEEQITNMLSDILTLNENIVQNKNNALNSYIWEKSCKLNS